MRGKFWLGVVVSAVLLWVAVRGVRLEEIQQSLAEVRPVWLLPVLLSIAVRFWLTAVRWQVLLRPVKLVGLHRLFGVVMIGFMANNVLPARLGEFVRAYALGKTESLSKSLAFATIVLERLFDGFTLLAFLLVGVLFLRPGPLIVWSAVTAFGLYLGILVVLMGIRAGRGVGWLLARLPGRIRDKAAGLLDSFALGLDVLGDARGLALSSVLSVAIWLVNAAGMWATFEAFSLHLPAYAAFVVLAIMALALVLPSTPGYVGPLQAGTVLALSLFSVPKAEALSLSIVYHAVNYVPITIAGLAYLAALNLTLGELRAVGEKPS
jgi:glycosyltransferase 2 family protein